MINTNPKISIIVPCYNVEQYLDRCMQSLMNQTLQDIEIILVDDGSPDRSPELCDEYARKDDRIKVVHKKNAGLGYARNSGLEIATGEYVAFVDSDDYIDTAMYSVLYEKASTNNCDAMFCGIKKELRNGNGWKDSSEVEEDLIMEGNEIQSFMLGMIASPTEEYKERKYSMSVWHSIYKREIIDKYGLRFHSERDVASEDLPFNVSFLKRSNRIGYVNRNFYYYCLNQSSLSSTFKKEKFDAFMNLYHFLSDELKDIPEAHIRCDRFIIGYTRSHMIQMMGSNVDSKMQHIRKICSHPIWNDISKRYTSDKIKGLFKRLHYRLLVGRQSLALYVISIMAARIKS